MKRFAFYTMLICAALICLLAAGISPRTNNSRALKIILEENDSVSIIQTLLDFEQKIRQAGSYSMNLKGSNNDNESFVLVKLDLIDLSIDRETATAECHISFGESKSKNFSVTFQKTRSIWSIHGPKEILSLEKTAQRIIASKNPQDITMLPPTTANRMLIGGRHPGTIEDMNVFVVNQNLAQEYLDVSLFAPATDMNIDAILTGIDGWEVGFTTDRTWNRIIYGWQHPDDRWIRAYGGNPGDHVFGEISGLAIDPFDTIFVLDKRLRVLSKLFYSRVSRYVSFVSEMQLPGLLSPCDVSFDRGTSACDPNDGDGLWISDPGAGEIVKISRSGQVVKRITHYTQYGLSQRLASPRDVVYSGLYLGVIDAQRNQFIALNVYNIQGTTAAVIDKFAFSWPNRPSTLGLDIFGQFWVGDADQKMYYAFSKTGHYLASMPSDINGRPLAISRTQRRFFGGCSEFSAIPISTADTWGPYSGFRYLLPGSDIVRKAWSVLVNYTTGARSLILKYSITNKSNVTVDLKPLSGHGGIRLRSGALEAGDYIETVSGTSVPYGDLVLEVNHEPFYNSYYSSDDQRSWRDTMRLYNPEPIVMQSASGPIPYPLAPYQAGHFSVNASGGVGSYIYDWSVKAICCTHEPALVPDECANFAEISDWNHPEISHGSQHDFILRAIISDQWGFWVSHSFSVNVGSCFPNPNPPSGCPFVYTWNGSEYVQDNNILPQSALPGNEEMDVTDYYGKVSIFV